MLINWEEIINKRKEFDNKYMHILNPFEFKIIAGEILRYKDKYKIKPAVYISEYLCTWLNATSIKKCFDDIDVYYYVLSNKQPMNISPDIVTDRNEFRYARNCLLSNYFDLMKISTILENKIPNDMIIIANENLYEINDIEEVNILFFEVV